jgi:hypothetical protein
MNPLYAVFGAESQCFTIPMDGNSIMKFYMGCLPTSRGTVTLGSNDSSTPPVIDPNYYAKHVMCEDFRMHSKLMFNMPEGKDPHRRGAHSFRPSSCRY